jgi:NAD(P)-dependent dehydrogenase (short-subunit alcohol dehydrogenase family)
LAPGEQTRPHPTHNRFEEKTIAWLDNKVVLITGASSGIGEEAARVLGARRADRLAMLAWRRRGQRDSACGGRARGHHAALRFPRQPARSADRNKRYGPRMTSSV